MKAQSIAHLFFNACDEFDKPNAVMVKQEGTYKPYSHKFFRQRVNHLARGLLKLGVKPGDHIALLSETRFEWAIADFAIISTGAVDVPVYPTLTAEQIAWILNNSESSGILVSDAEQAQKILSIKDQLPHLRFMIMFDDTPPEGFQSVVDVETMGSREDNENELDERWRSLNTESILTIIYTSGTTGNPKGVVLSHGNLLANIASCEPLMPYTSEDIHLSHLPLCHVLERMGGYYCMIYRGVTIAYAENIKTVPENIIEVKPTVLVSVPRLFEKIYTKVITNAENSGFLKRKIFHWAMGVGKQALPYLVVDKPLPGMLARKWNIANKLVFSKVRERMGGRLKFLTSGGAPLAKEIAIMFLGMGLKILEGYGLTETSPVLTINRLDHIKPGTVGPPLDSVEIKIAEDGEILARGPNLMQGYFKNPVATSEAIVDGWFHTGDIGELDQDNFLRITDRKKDLLVTSGGKNIAPQPLENSLKLSPLIEYAVVIGDKRNFITALIVPPWETVTEWAPKAGWPVEPSQLVENKDFLKTIEEEIHNQMGGFAHYEKVKKFTVLPTQFTVDSGELTPSLKVKRKIVNQTFASVIEDMYA